MYNNNEAMEKAIEKFAPISDYIMKIVGNINGFKNEYEATGEDVGIGYVMVWVVMGIAIIGIYLLYYFLWKKKTNDRKEQLWFWFGFIWFEVAGGIVVLGEYLKNVGGPAFLPIIALAISAVITICVIRKCQRIYESKYGIKMALLLFALSQLYQVVFFVVGLFVFVAAGIGGIIYLFVIGHDTGGYPATQHTYSSKESDEHDWYKSREYVRDKSDDKYKVGKSGEYVEDKKGNWQRVHRDEDGRVYLDDGDGGYDENDRLY